MLERLMHDNTDGINADSVKLQPFTDVNHPIGNLNSNNPTLYLPLDPNLFHKSQSTNPIKEHTIHSTS